MYELNRCSEDLGAGPAGWQAQNCLGLPCRGNGGASTVQANFVKSLSISLMQIACLY